MPHFALARKMQIVNIDAAGKFASTSELNGRRSMHRWIVSQSVILFFIALSLTSYADGNSHKLIQYGAVPRIGSGIPDEQDCRNLAERWKKYQKKVIEEHQGCLSEKTKSSGKPGVSCSYADCEQLHVLMVSLASGQIASFRLAQEEYCQSRAEQAKTVRKKALAGFDSEVRPDFVGELRSIRRSRIRRDKHYSGSVKRARMRESKSQLQEIKNWRRQAQKDLTSYYHSETKRRAVQQKVWDNPEIQQTIKDIVDIAGSPKNLPRGIASGVGIVLESTMNNPGYVRTIDTYPKASQAIVRLIDLETRLRRKEWTYWNDLRRSYPPIWKQRVEDWAKNSRINRRENPISIRRE